MKFNNPMQIPIVSRHFSLQSISAQEKVAEKFLRIKPVLSITWESMMVKNHSNVSFVIKVLLLTVTGKITRDVTKIRDCFNVISVIVDFIDQTNLRTIFIQCIILSTNFLRRAYKIKDKKATMILECECLNELINIKIYLITWNN